ncbi:hypothetical protein BC826DRAFT_1109452 [Russula brevipes]|nr:hypothetical protein BC826DRAFT_1109452 [Russula brevipes]
MLRTLVRLGLPPLASESHISVSYCAPEQMPVYSGAPSFVFEGRPPRRHPFHSSPEERIVTFGLSIGLSDHFGIQSFTIVTRPRTLIALATTAVPEVKFIPWEDWGPSGTACFERHIDSLSDACMGERLAMISNFDRSLSLFDFNTMRVQNAMREVGHPSQNAVYPVVRDRAVIRRGRVFAIDVVSELPYISVLIPAPSNWESLQNYEERLAGLSKDVRGQTISLLCSSGN